MIFKVGFLEWEKPSGNRAKKEQKVMFFFFFFFEIRNFHLNNIATSHVGWGGEQKHPL